MTKTLFCHAFSILLTVAKDYGVNTNGEKKHDSLENGILVCHKKEGNPFICHNTALQVTELSK